MKYTKSQRRSILLKIMASDKNYLVDPTEEFFNPPYNPAEISPMGLLDGMYPQEDLENKPAGNLYYGVTDSHMFLSDDGATRDKSKNKGQSVDLAKKRRALFHEIVELLMDQGLLDAPNAMIPYHERILRMHEKGHSTQEIVTNILEDF
jgi:hypothetical protein